MDIYEGSKIYRNGCKKKKRTLCSYYQTKKGEISCGFYFLSYKKKHDVWIIVL